MIGRYAARSCFSDGTPIDYHAAVNGELTLAPTGQARAALSDDYQRMVEDGLLLDDAEQFDALLDRCRTVADKVNSMSRASR